MSTNIEKINNINQLMHNIGIPKNARFNIIFHLLKKCINGDTSIKDPVLKEIKKIIDEFDLTNTELSQELFIVFGNTFCRTKFDQYYTPITVSNFIHSVLIQNKKNTIIDPACGTGDLILQYSGKKIFLDIDSETSKLCELNCMINKAENFNVNTCNSLLDHGEWKKTANYVVLNPPFGSRTIIKNKDILNKYELGKNRDKQETAILFVELGMKLLKKHGILFAIIPTGYNGNTSDHINDLREFVKKYKILGIIKLPEFTFKKSGTGVNTTIWVIQNKLVDHDKPYKIFIGNPSKIGYDLYNKNTPKIWKFDNTTGEMIIENGQPVRNNELIVLANRFKCFNHQENIKKLNRKYNKNLDHDYEYVMSDALELFKVKTHFKDFLTLMDDIKANEYVTLGDTYTIKKESHKIVKNKLYRYIAIGNIRDIHSDFVPHNKYGWELPNRAKYKVNQYDILVSKLEGSVSSCIILCEKTSDIIVSNGITVLRRKQKCNTVNDELCNLVYNVMLTNLYQFQQNALATGSTMNSINDVNTKKILIKIPDKKTRKKVKDYINKMIDIRLRKNEFYQ